MDETGNPTTRGYVQSEPITLTLELESVSEMDAATDPRAVEIEINPADGEATVLFRGALVEADGLTWWERRICELEANGRGKPLDAAG